VAHALAHPDRNLTFAFLVGWPSLEAANRLVRAHHGEMVGRDYGQLRPAAEALTGRYPADATLLHRALAEDVLGRASSRRYGYAVRDVRTCASPAPLLPAEPGLEDHKTFLARLRREHGRKTGFWTLQGDLPRAASEARELTSARTRCLALREFGQPILNGAQPTQNTIQRFVKPALLLA